ncbi:MAG: hypothetical protein IKB01_14375 [Lachnospiraceae bacterium]|nr:hypothetical protein [Lachnospiraceae bacterium]
MIENKYKHYILCIGFFICILCLPISYIWTRNHIDTANYQNRPLAERPVLAWETLPDFPQDLEDYFNDHLPYKNQLTKMINQIKYHLFRRSASEDVIIGQEGWLFYKTTTDGSPMEQYFGRDLYTEEELMTIAENLILSEKYMADKGIEFVLLILPNKERVYYDKMPEQYAEPAEMYGTRQLVEYLRENTDIRVVYPYEKLMKMREEYPDIDFYLHGDTHWNHAGAYVGTYALYEELGMEMVPFEELEMIQNTGSNLDLAGLINMRDYYMNDVNYEISGYKKGNIVCDYYDVDTEIILHNEDVEEGKIFVIRDSFASNMDDYLANGFAETYMVHNQVFEMEMIEQQDPDVVVIETVERFAEGIIKYRFE